MNLPFTIARKYFGNYLLPKSRGGKRINSIQILTLISILTAIIVSTAAIIVLSIFNGLTFLLGDINQSFYPDVKIEPKQGKVFAAPDSLMNQIESMRGVDHASAVLEEIAWLEFRDRQMIVTVKGVDDSYLNVTDIEESMYRGNFKLEEDGKNFAVIGLGISNELKVFFRDPLEYLTVFVPQRKQRFIIGPAAQFGRLPLKVAGEFAIQKEFDEKYLFVPLKALRPLLQYENQASHIELKLDGTVEFAGVKKLLEEELGKTDFEIKNRQQQNESWYKLMRFEKWMSFAILVLIMLIASFNLLSSLTMMVLDKKKDIGILKSMGLTDGATASIFRWQGFLIGLFGSLIGAALAYTFVLLQQRFGFIPLKGNFVVDSYPIHIELVDVLLTIGCVVFISWLASIFPSIRVQKQAVENSL